MVSLTIVDLFITQVNNEEGSSLVDMEIEVVFRKSVSQIHNSKIWIRIKSVICSTIIGVLDIMMLLLYRCPIRLVDVVLIEHML